MRLILQKKKQIVSTLILTSCLLTARAGEGQVLGKVIKINNPSKYEGTVTDSNLESLKSLTDFCAYAEKDLDYLKSKMDVFLEKENINKILHLFFQEMTQVKKETLYVNLPTGNLNLYTFTKICTFPNKKLNKWITVLLTDGKNGNLLIKDLSLIFDGSKSLKRDIPFHFRNFYADKEAKRAILEYAPIGTDREEFDQLMKRGGASLGKSDSLGGKEKAIYMYKYHKSLLTLNGILGIPDYQKVIVAVFRENKLDELR